MDWTLTREQWEEPGYRVEQHTGSPPLDWNLIENVAIHYPGVPYTIPPNGSLTSYITVLQGEQRYYVNQRDYSIGYNASVWGDKTAELRGDAFRCAANGNPELNRNSFAIQVRAGGQNANGAPAGPDAIASINNIITWCQNMAGRELDIVGHRDLKPTGCPGDGLYQQIQDGVFHAAPAPQVGLMFKQERILDVQLGAGVELQVTPPTPNARGVFVNITVVNPSGAGHMVVWPSATPFPDTSNLNWSQSGGVTANLVAVGLNAGNFSLKIPQASARVIVDLQAAEY